MRNQVDHNGIKQLDYLLLIYSIRLSPFTSVLRFISLTTAVQIFYDIVIYKLSRFCPNNGHNKRAYVVYYWDSFLYTRELCRLSSSSYVS